MPSFARRSIRLVGSSRGSISIEKSYAMGMNKQADTFSPWGEVVFSEVPEPKPVLLMGLGLGGLAVLSQRRRRVL